MDPLEELAVKCGHFLSHIRLLFHGLLSLEEQKKVLKDKEEVSLHGILNLCRYQCRVKLLQKLHKVLRGQMAAAFQHRDHCTHEIANINCD